MKKRKATYDDLLELPEHLVGEIIDGELVVSARPAMPHTRAASDLGTLLGGPFRFGKDGPGGWWILDEPELHLHADVVVPDLAGWRKQRMPSPPDEQYLELPPDWACEVLSPSTAKHDRRGKMKIYARERVEYLWFLDPIARTLEIYRWQEHSYFVLGVQGKDPKVRVEPFDAIELNLEDVWGPEPVESEHG
jgi:Uma2 family endonuclease